MNIVRILSFILLGSLTLFIACNDDEDPKPFTVNFTNTEGGISSTAPSVEVGITFSRATPSDGELTIGIGSSDLTYGSTADFFTTPEATADLITIAYAKGDQTASFTISSGEGLNIQQDESIVFSLNETDKDFILGEQVTFTVTFSENFIAPSGTMEFDGGGEAYPNQAFVDLSKLVQTSVDKFTWDLGFYTAAGEHSVILNSPAFVMARALDKTDLTQVTAEDTAGFIGQMAIPQFDPSVGAHEWIDTPDGNLSTTAFGDIPSSDASVFIIKRDGEGRNWKKVRVLQNGDGYTLEYADIAATNFMTADITKDEMYNYIHFDLDNGETSVEPAKDSWDLMFCIYSELAPFGPGVVVPYPYKDYVVSNRAGVMVGMVMIADVTYDEFGIGNIGDVQFSDATNAMGSSWRSGGGPTSANIR
jgi:hypothetical protein